MHYFQHVLENLAKNPVHLLTTVHFLHVSIGVHVALSEELHVDLLDRETAVGVGHHAHNVLKRQVRCTLELSGAVFAQGAHGQ